MHPRTKPKGKGKGEGGGQDPAGREICGQHVVVLKRGVLMLPQDSEGGAENIKNFRLKI